MFSPIQTEIQKITKKQTSKSHKNRSETQIQHNVDIQVENKKRIH